MTPEQFVKEFVEYYNLKDFMSFQRCSGKNLIYKKILIAILRDKFHLSFPQIAKIFKNTHATIMFHYSDIVTNKTLERNIEDAWKLHRSE